MTDADILSRFCKSAGPGESWHCHKRRFDSLGTHAAKRFALDLIREGTDPAKAIRKARQQQSASGSHPQQAFAFAL